MTTARGPAPPPENPLKTLRLGLKVSQEALAYQSRLSRQLIIRAEQAVYASPPPALLATLLDRAEQRLESSAVGFEFDEASVYHLYKEFQTHVRKTHYGRLSPSFDFANVPVGVHPFVDWRLRSGISARIGTAKFFCVHPALLHKYEMQPHLVQSTPGELVSALRESGYRKELLDSLGDAYDNYKEFLSERFKDQQERWGPA